MTHAHFDRSVQPEMRRFIVVRLVCELWDLQLEGKLALVSGSTAGIGFAIASALATEGARVILNGRTADRVNGAIEQIKSRSAEAKLEALPVDLGSAACAGQ